MGSRWDNQYWDNADGCDDELCDCHVEEDDVATEVEKEDGVSRTRKPKCTECGIYVGHIVGCPKGE